MKSIVLAFTAFLSVAVFAAKTPAGIEIPDRPQKIVEFRLDDGEGLYGAAATFGRKVPFGLATQSCDYDLRRHNYGNHTAPVLISNRGRYVWCEEGFDFKIENGNVTLTSNEKEFKIGKAGTTLREAFKFVSKNFLPTSGKTPDLLFVAAPQWNTWIELGLKQNQKAVLEYAHKIVDSGFPAGVMMIDDTWQRDYGVWRFDNSAFPDPKAMCDELHRLGFRIILWTCPFVSMDSAEYRHLSEKGALLKDGWGRPAAITWWDGVSAVLNFDVPYAKAWYKGELDKLVKDYGIDGFKFDAGDTGYYDTADQRLKFVGYEQEGDLNRHNRNWSLFAAQYQFNEMRASWKCGGQPLVQRLCDKGCDFGAVQQLIPDMINTGLMGNNFVCPDMIGGGDLGAYLNSELDQECFVRSAQVHALCPMMQFSAAPWRVLDAEHFAAVKKAVAIRQKFAPRFVELARECAVSGEPMLRSMEYQFPGHGYELIKDQFVMGDFLIVAPQVEKGAKVRKVIIPAGEWVGDDGETYEGPREIVVSTPLDRIPHFVRK